MPRVLFVSNGHGEASIAERIARDLSGLTAVRLEHLPLVHAGDGEGWALETVGPRAAMPSGGLVAMGNVRAFSRDLRAGFLGLFTDQIGFVRGQGKQYQCVVAVGDAYALAVSLLAGRPTIFVGTAKSVYVAGYGPFERFLLRRAKRIFVRDELTASALREQGVPAEAPGNVIVDLCFDDAPEERRNEAEWIGVLPGSREAAYDDGLRLARIIRAMSVRALFSIAPSLDPAKFEQLLLADGWLVTPIANDPTKIFQARASGAQLLAWRGALGSLLHSSRLVLGQAGTANEAAASCGIPVVALETNDGGWYRMRQQRLLGDALITIPAEPQAAASALRALLNDRARMDHMSTVGRERMGKPGGARNIAGAIAKLCS